ncbi:MAG: hypothetical protein M1821_006826, partial [Bathelium mastoideum]
QRFHIILLMRDDINVNKKDILGHLGVTPLSRAATNGHTAVVKLLLARDDIIICEKDNWVSTPLSNAAANGHKEILELLLAKVGGIDWNAQNQDITGRTPLHCALHSAVANGHWALVDRLLASNTVSLEYRTEEGWTILKSAVEKGHDALVKQLLVSNAVDLDRRTKEGWTLLTWAAAHGREAGVEHLLAKGADPERRADLDPRLTLDLNAYTRGRIDGKCMIDADFIVHGIPLSFAANNGHVTIVKQLLSKGVDINHKARYRQMPLLFAGNKPQGGFWDRSVRCVEKSVDVNDKDANERTPLLLAAANGHEAVVQLLLEEGAELQSIKPENMFISLNKDRQTRESWVKDFNKAERAVRFIPFGPFTINTQRPFPSSLLTGPDPVEVKWLLEKSVKVTHHLHSSIYKLSPMPHVFQDRVLVENGHKAVVQLLGEKATGNVDVFRVDIACKDKEDQTPLSSATKRGRIAVVKLI